MMIESEKIYDGLAPGKKDPVIEFLKVNIPEDVKGKIRSAIIHDPVNWFVAYHLNWGQSVRKLLRKVGYSEAYFEVASLDDVYVGLIEEAVMTIS